MAIIERKSLSQSTTQFPVTQNIPPLLISQFSGQSSTFPILPFPSSFAELRVTDTPGLPLSQ